VGSRRAGLGSVAVLAAIIWSAHSARAGGAVDVNGSVLPVAVATALVPAPSQGDPGIPEPVIPQPPPEPVQIPVEQPAADPGPPPLYPPELSGGPGLVPPGMSGPGGTTPLSGQGNAGLSSAPALVAPIEQPQPSTPDPDLAPYTVPGSSRPGVAPFGCPDDVAPGELLPPAIWSVCPGLQPPGWWFSPFLPYPQR
jgi:hypothetical protein